MSNGAQEILDALKYTTAERLKSTQRKLATARNTITGEALTHPYNAFFSEDEKEVLGQAARILGQFKSKIEHAKEIRSREEKRKKLHLERCRSLRQKLLSEHIKSPSAIDDHRETVIFHLSLQDFKDTVARYRGAHFGHGIGWIEEDLAYALDDKRPHQKTKHIAPLCYRESCDWLGENLWVYDVEPDPACLESAIRLYRDEWRSVTLTRYRDFFERYDAALRDEFETEAAADREKQALQRRAAIKAIK